MTFVIITHIRLLFLQYDWSGGKDTPLWAKVANKK